MRLFKKLLAASALSLAAIVPGLSMAAAPAPVSAGYAVGPQRLAPPLLFPCA